MTYLKKYIVTLLVVSCFSPTVIFADQMNVKKERISRYQRGLAKLGEIDKKAGKNMLNALADVSPDLAKYTIEFPFGDVYSRAGLELKSREVATIAALTVLGYAIPQLKVHIAAGLNAGLTQGEIKEIIIQMSIYAGFPAALNAMLAAKEVFSEQKKR